MRDPTHEASVAFYAKEIDKLLENMSTTAHEERGSAAARMLARALLMLNEEDMSIFLAALHLQRRPAGA